MLKALPKFDKILLAIAIALLATTQASADFRVLYAFEGENDGGFPRSRLALDHTGNLYGTTSIYGATDNGTIFRVSAQGNLATLYSFGSKNSNGTGYLPAPSALFIDETGTLFGTTPQTISTGKNHCTADCGSVFKLTPDGEEVALHTFENRMVTDGKGPVGRLALDDAGNFYGATQNGGSKKICYGGGCGTVFKIAPDGTETILHVFTGGRDTGFVPQSGLVRDQMGNLYGTVDIYQGSAVYKIAPDGSARVTRLEFGGAVGDLIIDKKGNLYGEEGGYGYSVIYALTPEDKQTTLYRFYYGSTDGSELAGGLLRDKAGNLYGVTADGGDLNCKKEVGAYGCGTVFKLAPDGTKTTLYAFHGGNDGFYPTGGVVADKSGNLYGTTVYGGDNTKCGSLGCGTVFEIAP